MRTPHKLAAVLFADIAGYTAMMAENEEHALEKLTIFKEQLNKAILLNSGQLVQYFGDGALCTFESSVKAIECAIQLQSALGKGNLVPVRIGIHTGDVIFKEGNVFGDAVNVASRIESIGQAGTILVSKSVMNQVKSINEFQFTSLGEFEFKNINEPLEVYAISSLGFRIPDKKILEGKLKTNKGIKRRLKKYKSQIGWLVSLVIFLLLIFSLLGDKLFKDQFSGSYIQLLQKEGVVLFDFSNETGDPQYDDLQCLINRQLRNVFTINDIKVLNNSTLCLPQTYFQVLKSQLSYGPEFESLIDSKFVLDGKISIIGDSLSFNVGIFNSLNAKPVFFPVSVQADKTKPIDGVILLINTLIESWNFQVKPEIIKTPEQIDWEREYRKAVSYFEKDENKVLEHAARCKQIDPDNYLPDLLAMEVYRAYDRRFELDSILKLLQVKLDEMVLKEDEANLVKASFAIYRKNYHAALEYYKKVYERSPKDLFTNYAMISHAVQLTNDAELAVEVGEEINYDKLDYSDYRYGISRMTLLSRALIQEEKYEEALQALNYIEKTFIDTLSSGIPDLQIRALIRMNNEEGLKDKLEITKHKPFKPERNHAYFLHSAAYEYYLLGNKSKVMKYKTMFDGVFESDNGGADDSRKGRMEIYAGEYEKAAQTLKSVAETYRQGGQWKYMFDGYYGYALARSGNISEANGLIGMLEENKPNHDDILAAKIAYYQAQICAGLKDRERTIQYLVEALSKGKRFYRWEFQYDPLFHEISRTKEFDSLINHI